MNKKHSLFGGDEEKQKTYEIEVRCTNCSNTKYVDIPWGKLSSTYIKQIPCEGCGCKKLKKYNYEDYS